MANKTPTSFDRHDGPQGKSLHERLTLLEEAILAEDWHAMDDFSLDEMWMLNRIRGIPVDGKLEDSVTFAREIGIDLIRSAIADEDGEDTFLYETLLVVFPEMAPGGDAPSSGRESGP